MVTPLNIHNRATTSEVDGTKSAFQNKELVIIGGTTSPPPPKLHLPLHQTITTSFTTDRERKHQIRVASGRS